MAPNLAKSTLVLIHDMIASNELTTSQMAKAAGCSKRAIIRIRSNLRLFGSVKAPPIKPGRPRSITPIMLEALCDHLLEKPDLYLHEMELFFLDEFEVSVPKSTISDALHRKGCSKKTARQKAKERNPDLQNFRNSVSHDRDSFIVPRTLLLTNTYHEALVLESVLENRWKLPEKSLILVMFYYISNKLPMHHPSDDIPWHLVASNLHWAPGALAPQVRALNLPQLPGKLKDKKGCACGATNLHPNSPAPKSFDRDGFTEAFAKAVSDASKRKRAQYPEKYSSPNPSDVLLGDELFEKVDSLLSRRIKGGPRLPFEQRTASAFLHPWECDDYCNFLSTTEIGFLNLEVVKMLLMLGELGPILQACAHPDEGLSGWYSAAACDCMASPFNLGWDRALFRALEAYIALNVALCFPQIYDPTAGRTDETDYRHTAFYQSMLRRVTESHFFPSEATPYPHQQFFGIPRDHFCEESDMSSKIDQMHWLHRTDIIKRAGHYGLLSFDEFLNLEGPLDDQYQPLESDVESVKQELLSKSLPLDIVLMIMDFADYKAKRVLEVPHDPLHPANRAELDHYLDQCWQIIIGCNIMNNEFGGDTIDWQDLVHSEVRTLFYRPERPYYLVDSITGMKCTGI